MAKILITGATGFIGSNLLRRLVKTEHEIHILHRTGSNFWRIVEVISHVKQHEVDLSEAEKLKKIIGSICPDYIFHLANAGLYGGVSSSDAGLVKTNLLGLIHLLDALHEVPYKGFINVGSSSEYGLAQSPMREDGACAPINVYGITKLAATCYANYLGKIKGKPIMTFRLFSPFGPYDDHRRLISKTILALSAGHNLSLANPNAVRDYIFIDDVIDLLLKSMEKSEAYRGEIFNVGCGKEHTIKTVVDIITREMRARAKIEWGQAMAQPLEPATWEADMTKTFASFDWRPRYPLEEGLEKSIAWFQNNSGLYPVTRKP